MYFPYLRGRQNELIAVRELLEAGLLSEKVIPIIEPVKVTPSLAKTLESFKKKSRKIIYIVNPDVGNYNQDLDQPKNKKMKDKINALITSNSSPTPLEDIILGMILDSCLIDMQNYKSKYTNSWSVISKNVDTLHNYTHVFHSDDEITYNLIPDDASFRRRIKNNKVMLANRFKKLERNTDYPRTPYIYSEDHLYYESEGYTGFSDYSVVGEDYSETGFAPYAVAIHIVYFDEEKILKIIHFVSDSNADHTDTAGKFSEALEKLIDWKRAKEASLKLDTLTMRKFQKLYDNKSYPGLGVVKKLSIMHHLELVSKYLDGDI